MEFLYYALLTLLVTIAVLLILLILIQKGRGGGLSSAFGGGGGSTAFGAKTGDVLTWATSIVFGVFILLAVLLDLVVGSMYKSTAPTVTPLATSSVPVIPAPVQTDNTPPPVSPAPSAPLVTPGTNPITAIEKAIQNATTQPINALKSTTQP